MMLLEGSFFTYQDKLTGRIIPIFFIVPFTKLIFLLISGAKPINAMRAPFISQSRLNAGHYRGLIPECAFSGQVVHILGYFFY
jgi:hypothetical protein